EVHEVVVLVGGAERLRRLQVRDLAQDLLAAPRRAEAEQVVPAQPGAVAQQVADCHLAVGERVGQTEVRQGIAHRVVPPHPAVVAWSSWVGGGMGKRVPGVGGSVFPGRRRRGLWRWWPRSPQPPAPAAPGTCQNRRASSTTAATSPLPAGAVPPAGTNASRTA